MNPVCVIINDIHFSVPTLKLASAALRQAQKTAYDLSVPLVIAGDLLDSKAIIRAECANELISIFDNDLRISTYIIPGNHCMLNEKGDGHALNFLKPYVNIVDRPTYIRQISATLIPYQNDVAKLQEILDGIPKGSRIISHQGVQTAYMGHYVQDKTSLPKEAFSDFRVVSGHYHRAQDIKCGRPQKGAVGLFSYTGNPYTLNFSESSDGPKGYAILNDDGTLTHLPTNLRRHTIIEWTYGTPHTVPQVNEDDLVWLKVTGPASEIKKLSKDEYAHMFMLPHSNYKLDLLPEISSLHVPVETPKTEAETLDLIVDRLKETSTQKEYLKILWREVMYETT